MCVGHQAAKFMAYGIRRLPALIRESSQRELTALRGSRVGGRAPPTPPRPNLTRTTPVALGGALQGSRVRDWWPWGSARVQSIEG